MPWANRVTRNQEISENTIHRHGKLDRQKIAPLSHENIRDEPYVKRQKTCLTLRCAECHGLHGDVKSSTGRGGNDDRRDAMVNRLIAPVVSQSRKQYADVTRTTPRSDGFNLVVYNSRRKLLMWFHAVLSLGINNPSLWAAVAIPVLKRCHELMIPINSLASL